MLLEVAGGFGKIAGAPEVAPVVFVGAEGKDLLALGRETEIGVDYGEGAVFVERGEQARGNNVDPGEGERRRCLTAVLGFGQAGIFRIARNGGFFLRAATADELKVLVEEEETGRCAGLDGKRGEGAAFVVKCEHAVKIDVADDVDVVKKEGLRRTGRPAIASASRHAGSLALTSGLVLLARGGCFGPGSQTEILRFLCLGGRARDDLIQILFAGCLRTFQEEPGGFFQAAAGVQQEIVFARNFDAQAEIVVRLQVGDDHVRKVMDIDDNFVHAETVKTREGDFKKRAAGDFDQRLGARVGKRTEARAEAGGEDHGFHGKTGGASERGSSERLLEAWSNRVAPRDLG